MDSAEPHQLSAELQQTARSLGRLLLQHGQRVVFAESCTAGLVAASLAIVPGISRCLCGSLVTYREASKTAWLGVDAQLIAAFTAVSPEVTAQMASAALQRTIEADWAAAVTGH
ncbi:MAG: CinA family protein, partial [Planctomycetota bacterium]